MKKKLIAVLAGVAVAGIAAVAYKKHKESKEETTSEEVNEKTEDVEETTESTESTEKTKTYRFSKIKGIVSKNKGISKVKAYLSSIKVAKDSAINRISEKAKKRIMMFAKTFVFSTIISFLLLLIEAQIVFYKRNGMSLFKAGWLMGKAEYDGDMETYKHLKEMH